MLKRKVANILCGKTKFSPPHFHFGEDYLQSGKYEKNNFSTPELGTFELTE